MFSLDSFIAIGIFIFIILLSAILWDYGREKISVEETRNDMGRIARNALSALAETKGNPANWTEYDLDGSTITSLGLASEFLVIDTQKINSLSLADYADAKKMLGVLGPGYEFTLKLYSWNGSEYLSEYSAGIEPDAASYEVVKTERAVLLNDSWARATLKLWKSCEDITC